MTIISFDMGAIKLQ